MKKQRFFAVVISIILVMGIFATGCRKQARSENIVILYTSDAHGAIDDNIGYAGVAAYTKACKKESPYVSLVDIGDSIQGGNLATLSQGKDIIDIMNDVGYEIEVLGNHEFDYGLENLKELRKTAKFPYVTCNIGYTGNGENLLSDVKPYVIKEYGNTKVGFVGVLAPETLDMSTPQAFSENGKKVYSLYGENKDRFYDCVQKNIDECRKQGAEYVILLTHLGDTENFGDFSSRKLIENTSGANIVLDGHAHNIVNDVIKNKLGEDISLSATGLKLANIGKLTISPDGKIATELISEVTEKDNDVVTKINEKKRILLQNYLKL